MSLYSNRSSLLFKKSRDFIEIPNFIKTNRNFHKKSFTNQKLNFFLNNCNVSKSLNLIKNKSYLIPQIYKKNKSKTKKNNLKTYLISKEIIPKNPFINIKEKNTRNHNINLNTINQFNLEKEFNSKTYTKTVNINKNGFNKFLFKNISIDNKNIKKNYKYYNDFFLKGKNNSNNKQFKYHSDKKTNKLFNKFIKGNQNPLKLFFTKKNFSDLNESLRMEKNITINKGVNNYNSIIKDYCCRSEAGTDIFGKLKTNQDSYLSLFNIYNLKNYSVFGIFDGHGINGHLVSQFVKKYFENFFTNIDNNNGNLYNKNENYIFKELIKENKIKEMFKLLDNLLLEKHFSIQYSGTTCLIIIYIGDKIICYNIGDSRAVYINKDFKCIPISKDHKPENNDEKLRIEESGGIVKKDYLNYGIYRVWSKNGKYPGLAMSRSIGDYVAKSLGVINEPDIYEINIVKNNVNAIILSSDGLWDVINYNQLEKIMLEYIKLNDCIGCVNELTFEAKKLYNKKNISSDDITIIVIFFEIKQ